MIETLKAYKPSGSQLIVCGCLPKISESKLKEVHDGTIIYGEHDVNKLNKLINAKYKIEDVSANFLYPSERFIKRPSTSNNCHPLIQHLFYIEDEFYSKLCEILWSPLLFYDSWLDASVNIFHKNDSTFYIKAATGCTNCCAYCAVKKSRGHLKSKALNKVLDEFRCGLQQGYKHFALLGTDLGPYGRDIGVDLVTLLGEMIRENGDYRIRIRNIEPMWLLKMWTELKEILKSKRISFMGIPIESGNNDILKAMRRMYRIEDIKACVKELNEEFPFIFTRTQLMTGFPGERLEQFHDTCRLIDEVFFDYVEVYSFSPRPNTLAAKMKNQIPKREKMRRRKKLWLKGLLMNTSQKLHKIYEEKNLVKRRPTGKKHLHVPCVLNIVDKIE